MSESGYPGFEDFQDRNFYDKGVNIDSQFNSEVDCQYLEASQATATIRLNNVYEHES